MFLASFITCANHCKFRLKFACIMKFVPTCIHLAEWSLHLMSDLFQSESFGFVLISFNVGQFDLNRGDFATDSVRVGKFIEAAIERYKAMKYDMVNDLKCIIFHRITSQMFHDLSKTIDCVHGWLLVTLGIFNQFSLRPKWLRWWNTGGFSLQRLELLG